ncbi:uncharacterized protein LAESUDRAFT_728564 [Laetiporus sulphureus 93-53]|uniref:Rho GTPase activation protein n=1 Tax=Laetiporus sulphureus 93-53 TaxID=1314785 RepID=A0A165D0E6_9APHY|nr:uncharacterized protein LAESUDRAFT_728564 [Laetiporus sulphureus 93-53]KZT03884.1 hypothetical protein LAESUDRAFT_728564 [Laetiporus sulphureus 93-53]
MAPRRGASSNSLSPPDITFPGSGGTSPGTSPSSRSASPANGFTQFLTRPTKWFNRSTSANGGRNSVSSNEPRTSTSSGATGRKPKISHPTDPRPFLENLRTPTDKRMTAASRSVLDLSLTHDHSAYDELSGKASPRTSSSPSQPALSRGLGDLRNISRKPWSKSADDLGKLSYQRSSPILTPIDTTIHDKIDQYRTNRGGSVGSMSNAPSPTSSSVMSAQKNYPFPVISQSPSEPLSASPPSRPSIQLATSSPTSTTGAALTLVTSNGSGHVHARSHSFTPRLTSKLAAPKVALQPPPSPRQKGSATSDRQTDRDREKSLSGGSSAASARSPFPFSRSGSGGKTISPVNVSPSRELVPPASVYLAPPKTDSRSDGSGSKSEKRTSQVVYHSGFVNRLVDFSPAVMNMRANYSYMSGGQGALSKGWKPFKLVLKGSKLYFYKPPSDRSAAVKELFATELVTLFEDEGVVNGDAEQHDTQEGGVERGGRLRDRQDMHKRRAYWGRNTHPSLLIAAGRVQGGNLEALVHEAVFATTFPDAITSKPESVDGQGSRVSDSELRENSLGLSESQASWCEFAATVVFSSPVLVGRGDFETEFMRCCSNFVNGAEEKSKDDSRARVRWLAAQYLTYYGTPFNRDAWENWRKDSIPDFPANFEATSKLGGIPQTSSMQALYTASPQLNPAGAGGLELSPDLGAFSPRPNKMMSIVEALGEPPSIAGMAAVRATKTLLASLERDGLTRDILISLDAQLLAHSLSVFNQSLFKNVPDNLTVDLCLGTDSLAPSGIAAGRGQTTSHTTFAAFFGRDDQPHWLTRMVLVQILVPESSGSSTSPTVGSEERHAPASRTSTRAGVIAAWAKVGELCRKTGDECSWRAIFAALCSRPVARLERVWKRVGPEVMSLVQSWVHVEERSGASLSGTPLVIPWAEDSRRRIKASLEKARIDGQNEWRIESLSDARARFEALRTTFALCSKQSVADSSEETHDVEALTDLWRSSFEGRSLNAMASKFVRIDQFMSLSLAAEPRRKGLFEPLYWARTNSSPTFHPLTAVLFPEPLPAVTFINREHLFRGRLESSASISMQDLQNAREIWLRPAADGSMRAQTFKSNGLDLRGTVLPVFDGDLLLLVQPSPEPTSLSRTTSRSRSRPPSLVAESSKTEMSLSRSPSIRVTPGSPPNLDRKPSVIRRNSLPSISQRTSLVISEVNSEKSLRVVVQAGTLDRLVDILVHGLPGVSVSVADDNGEMPLSDNKTREVKVDMDDFSTIWWSVYRTFVTPQVLFELLRKRYFSARLSQSPTVREVNDVVRRRSEILETMNEWINRGGGAQDVLDDLQLHSSFESFLAHCTEELWQHLLDDDAHKQRSLGLLEQLKKTLDLTFRSQTMRPTPVPSLQDSIIESTSSQSFGLDAPDIDRIDAEELVNNLDAMASSTFRNVSQEDLFVTSDLLEVQSADKTGWFLSREPSSIYDEVDIQFMDSYITEVEPSTMISELAQGSLHRMLPQSIRTCVRAFTTLRRWLVSKLAAAKLGLRGRESRMELMLRAVEICRLRNAESFAAQVPLAERPCVRSFVETVLTSAIVSVESRAHYRAWQNVALGRLTTCDTLAALISKPAITSVASRSPLTVDIGWILERMVEVIMMPDVLESAQEGASSLVNYDKRRSLHTLISSVSGSAAVRSRQRRIIDRRDLERLSTIEREVSAMYFDLRTIREEAYREATQAGILGAKKIHRPFQTLVALQQEKNRRDRHLRDRLSREKRQEQQQKDKREEYLTKAMNTRRPPAPTPKQHRNKKSVSSAFFQLMRPISSAFSSDSIASAMKRSPAELDFTPMHKPILVLSVVDARVAQFVNNERSFTFQLDTEDGGHYLLQAIGKAEMKKWMDIIQHVSNVAAKRRLTYLGQNSKVQLADHLLSQPTAASRDPHAVFGVELDFLLRREAINGEVQPGTIPSVLDRLIAEVEARGLMEVGIYRIAGAHSEVNAYKDALNRGEWPITSSTDIHAVCDLIKSWFRVLPGGIFPSPSYNEILEAAARDGVDLPERLSGVRKAVHALPGSQFDLLKRIVEHLDKVTDYEENNQMTAESLATVFSPNLLRSPNNDISLFFANMSAGHRVTKLLIAHYHTIFDDEQEQEVDLERDQDEYELEEPIPEEDEDEDLLCNNGPQSPDDDDLKLPSQPPVLEVNLGSPHSLSFAVSA